MIEKGRICPSLDFAKLLYNFKLIDGFVSQECRESRNVTAAKYLLSRRFPKQSTWAWRENKEANRFKRLPHPSILSTLENTPHSRRGHTQHRAQWHAGKPCRSLERQFLILTDLPRELNYQAGSLEQARQKPLRTYLTSSSKDINIATEQLLFFSAGMYYGSCCEGNREHLRVAFRTFRRNGVLRLDPGVLSPQLSRFSHEKDHLGCIANHGRRQRCHAMCSI